MRRFVDKIVDIAVAKEKTTALKEDHPSATIGWTNGCFDLLHAGHVTYLEKARSLVDLLVVGINEDASVRRLKGNSRPLIELAGRQTVLSALESVDLVVSFAEDTPLDSILALKPDVIIKGADYTKDQVVGGKEATDWGGRIELIGLVGSWSTTKIAEKLNSDHS